MIQVGDCYFLPSNDERLVFIEHIENNKLYIKLIIKEGKNKYGVISRNINGTLEVQGKRKVDPKVFLKIEKLIKINFNICSTIISQAPKIPDGECEIHIVNSNIFATYVSANVNERITLGCNYISIRSNPLVSVFSLMFSRNTYIKIKEKTSDTIKMIEELWTMIKTS